MEYQQYIDSNGNTVRVPYHYINYTAMTVDYLMDNGYGHVTGMLSNADVEAFRSIVMRMPQHFRMVELGSFHGASAVTFALLASETGKTCDILCIDRFGATEQLKVFQQNTMDFSNITYRAETFFTSSFKHDGGSIDLYFDDASHEERPTYKQLVYWSQYAKNIAVHDYSVEWEGNVAAVDKFASERALQVETFAQSSVAFMENV
jgi:predicted O-methyltransferase YrrM